MTEFRNPKNLFRKSRESGQPGWQVHCAEVGGGITIPRTFTDEHWDVTVTFTPKLRVGEHVRHRHITGDRAEGTILSIWKKVAWVSRDHDPDSPWTWSLDALDRTGETS